VGVPRATTRQTRGFRHWEGHHPADARVQALGDPLDDAALARSVAPLEDHDHLETAALDRLLQLDELDLEPCQLLVVDLLRELLLVGHDIQRQIDAGVCFARGLVGVLALLVGCLLLPLLSHISLSRRATRE
jgi:hypothetical protein